MTVTHYDRAQVLRMPRGLNPSAALRGNARRWKKIWDSELEGMSSMHAFIQVTRGERADTASETKSRAREATRPPAPGTRPGLILVSPGLKSPLSRFTPGLNRHSVAQSLGHRSAAAEPSSL